MLEDLYAGADAAGRKQLQQLERDFDKVGRLLVPLLSDWTKTGDVLAQIAGKYGYEQIGRARMTNDTLIGTSAARKGITLLTVNGATSPALLSIALCNGVCIDSDDPALLYPAKGFVVDMQTK